MASYLKDKQAAIYKAVKGYNDDYGIYHKGGYAPIHKSPFLWCYTRQQSQDQVLEAKQYGSDETRLFIFNYRDDVELYQYIKYRGKWYTITRVDTMHDNKGDLYVYVQDTAVGDTPADSEIQKYLG